MLCTQVPFVVLGVAAIVVNEASYFILFFKKKWET